MSERVEVERAWEDVGEQRWESAATRLGELRGRAAVDEAKRRANVLLVDLAKGRYRAVDDYRRGLEDLFPQLADPAPAPATDRRLATQLYNAAVLAFHGGRWRRALQLLHRIAAMVSGGAALSRGLTRAFANGQLLAAELRLGLGEPEEAATAVAALTALLRRLKKTSTSTPSHLAHFRLHERIHAYKLRILLAQKKVADFAVASAASGTQPPRQPWKTKIMEAHLEQVKLSLAKTKDPAGCLGKMGDASRVYPQGWGLVNTGESGKLIFATGKGCVMGSLGKHNMALAEFSRAAGEAAGAGKRPSLFSAAHRLPLAYNLALANLRAGPKDVGEAQRCLQSLLPLVQMFPSNARLWLRLGEAALQGQLLGARRPQKEAFVGLGVHRKTLPLAQPALDDSEQSGAVPQLSLGFAAACLENGLGLLGASEEGTAGPGPPLSASERERVREALLGQSAYVALCLGRLQAALGLARELLERRGEGGGAWAGLARLYGAEAALGLGDASAAEALLDFASLPKTGPLRTAFLGNLAVLSLRLGKWTAGTNALRLLPASAADEPAVARLLRSLPPPHRPPPTPRIPDAAPRS